jgi:agmatinase
MHTGLFSSARPEPSPAGWALLGCPFDGTVSFRPGSRFGPAAIRAASYGIENFSWLQRRDLEELDFADLGDLELPHGDPAAALDRIREAARELGRRGARVFGLGGEHLVTLPLFEAALERYPELMMVQLDAHADLREDYLGERLSHASVMRRVTERIGPERLCQIGIRSGTSAERGFAQAHGCLCGLDHSGLLYLRQRVGARPVYLTLDLDILDPAFLPGTGTPEAGGLSSHELLKLLEELADLHVVAADVVELAPQLDPTGCSAVTAAKIVRELLLRFP